MKDSNLKTAATQEEIFDLLVVGSGPSGLACAIESQKAGLQVVVVDKGCLCNSLFHYPTNMTFFTTSSLLEIGGIPFPSPHQKPTRNEALHYYRLVAQYYNLDVRTYRLVNQVSGSDGNFSVHTIDRFGRTGILKARKLVLATGYYDLPNYLNIPGENLNKVHHYYDDPHPYAGMDVVVIGGKNSAAIAALELWRGGARVTLICRGAEITESVKYWIKPDLENRIKNGEITAFFRSHAVEVTPDSVTVKTHEGRLVLKNDFVFALTGYHPDFGFMESLGIQLEGPDRIPVHNPVTKETNVPGIYLAGVVLGGARTNEIFIENGRLHGRLIAAALSVR